MSELDEYLSMIERERESRPAEAMLADEIAALRDLVARMWPVFRDHDPRPWAATNGGLTPSQSRSAGRALRATRNDGERRGGRQ